MRVSLDSQLIERVHELKIGLIHYTKISVGDSPQMLKGRLQLFQEQLFFEIEEHGFEHFPTLTSYRTIFKQTGTNPTRYRPSAEALYRRVAKQNYMLPVHSGIDSNTFFSLYYGIPFGLYDTAHLDGHLHFAIGDESTSYEALNGRETTLTGILTSHDATGPFGSPYVDSVRTAVTTDTKDALHILYFTPETTEQQAEKTLEAVQSMFIQVHGGDSKHLLLTQSNPEGTI